MVLSASRYALTTRDLTVRHVSCNAFSQVVAADGTIFSKGGLITGGLSQGNRQRAEQWHAKDNDREKSVKQVCDLMYTEQVIITTDCVYVDIPKIST